jgi:hypothetical protein
MDGGKRINANCLLDGYVAKYLFVLCFLSCSNATPLNREKAIEKQVEAVNIHFDAIAKDYQNRDSLFQVALALISESLALDSTYLLAYQTKYQFRKEDRRRSE